MSSEAEKLFVKLFDLGERVKSAPAPDRQLDAEISVALNIGARGLLADDHEYLSLVRKGDGEAPGTYWFHCRSGKSLRTAPEFTGSVDAALTLKDAEWLLDIEQHFDAMTWEVEVWAVENIRATKASKAVSLSLPQAIASSALFVRAALVPVERLA